MQYVYNIVLMKSEDNKWDLHIDTHIEATKYDTVDIFLQGDYQFLREMLFQIFGVQIKLKKYNNRLFERKLNRADVRNIKYTI